MGILLLFSTFICFSGATPIPRLLLAVKPKARRPPRAVDPKAGALLLLLLLLL